MKIHTLLQLHRKNQRQNPINANYHNEVVLGRNRSNQRSHIVIMAAAFTLIRFVFGRLCVFGSK